MKSDPDDLVMETLSELAFILLFLAGIIVLGSTASKFAQDLNGGEEEKLVSCLSTAPGSETPQGLYRVMFSLAGVQYGPSCWTARQKTRIDSLLGADWRSITWPSHIQVRTAPTAQDFQAHMRTIKTLMRDRAPSRETNCHFWATYHIVLPDKHTRHWNDELNRLAKQTLDAYLTAATPTNPMAMSTLLGLMVRDGQSPADALKLIRPEQSLNMDETLNPCPGRNE